MRPVNKLPNSYKIRINVCIINRTTLLVVTRALDKKKKEKKNKTFALEGDISYVGSPLSLPSYSVCTDSYDTFNFT